jgi:hypothetical protein
MWKQISSVFGLLALATLNVSCRSVDTSKIDCHVDKIAVASSLTGTVSASGDRITGTLTVTCDGVAVKDVTIKGDTSWGWATGTMGPSDANGVINVARPAESLGHADVGTNKPLVITAHGENDSGTDAEKDLPTIQIPIG